MSVTWAMDVRAALKEQYHAGLAMLAQPVELCPDDLWTAPNPVIPHASPNQIKWDVDRPVWRIAFHAAYFTHLYLGQGESALQPPDSTAVGQNKEFKAMWQAPLDVEPYDLPAGTVPCRQSELLEYIGFVDGLVDHTVEGLDLDTEESGFHWYKNISKLSHQLLNLRHIQGHVGQLSELLIARGIDTDWMSKSKK